GTYHIHTLGLLIFLHHAARPDVQPLPLHDALPILSRRAHHGPVGSKQHARAPSHGAQIRELECGRGGGGRSGGRRRRGADASPRDRKSTRLNSSHVKSSYGSSCPNKKTK